jgi:multidrug efflux pump subunit AcrB
LPVDGLLKEERCSDALIGAFYPPFMVQIESDVYSQIGLVMLIGLAAKNAILIVEFAKDEPDTCPEAP